MTPGARVAAAIEILDAWRAGQPAEQALTRWARHSRFAGSKDRATIRDHVFDVLRAAETAEAIGGGSDGRALMLGLLKVQGKDPATIFTGEGYAPAMLSEAEKAHAAPPKAEALWNLPKWLVPHFEASLGTEAFDTAQILRDRAPVSLRVNCGKVTVAEAMARLAEQGITTEENPLCEGALLIKQGARQLRNSACYKNGEVELQDASSQAVVALLPEATRCLDYCAGGGGKALAMAAQPGRVVFAHDSNPKRMVDIIPRTERAGSHIQVLKPSEIASKVPFDLVLCDAPCSGSGAWRRSPEAKWAFTNERLKSLTAVQQDILAQAAQLTSPKGVLVYATCSVLKRENEEAMSIFLSAHPGWHCTFERRFPISAQGDGFYTAHLTRE